MNTNVPDDLNTVEDSAQLLADLEAEFDKLYEDGGDLTALAEIADKVDLVKGHIAETEAKADADAAKREDLRNRVRPAGAEDDTDVEPEVEPEAEPEPEPEVEADADADKVLEPVAASVAPKGANAAALAARNRPKAPPAPRAAGTVITASADVPGFSSGQKIDTLGIAEGMHSRARGLSDGSARMPVATIRTPVPAEFMINADSDVAAVITAAVESKLTDGTTAQALVASGGWCTPSETMYDQFSVEGRSGLIDLPTVGITRGGINVPSFFGISDAVGALWTWSEASDNNALKTVTTAALTANVATITTATPHGYVIGQTVTVTNVSLSPVFNGTFIVTSVPSTTTFTYARVNANIASAASTGNTDVIKGCLTIPCPTWTDYRLGAEGVCLSHGNLMDRSYPEMTRRFVDLTMSAHLHRVSNAKLSSIIATASAVTVTTAPSDVVGDTLNAIDLQVADFRSQHLMDVNVVLEAIFPLHVIEMIRSSLAMRAGVEQTNVSNADVLSHFTNRNVRPQFLHGYQPLWNGAARTTWPTTLKFLLFPAGSYVAGDGGAIDLGVVRDSTLNQTNDFTAAWSEQFFNVIRRGPAAREVTFTSDVDGQTGGPAKVAIAT